jgi:hypothetical protein
MLGMFVNLFLDFLEKENDAAGKNKTKRFNDDKIYADEEWRELFQGSCKKLNIESDLVESAFAHFFFRFIRERQASVWSEFLDSHSFFESLPRIHADLIRGKKKSRGGSERAEKLRVEQRDSPADSIVIHYRSDNRMCRFLEALAGDIIRFYGEGARVEHLEQCMKTGDPECEIGVSWIEK